MSSFQITINTSLFDWCFILPSRIFHFEHINELWSAYVPLFSFCSPRAMLDHYSRKHFWEGLRNLDWKNLQCNVMKSVFIPYLIAPSCQWPMPPLSVYDRLIMNIASIVNSRASNYLILTPSQRNNAFEMITSKRPFKRHFWKLPIQYKRKPSCKIFQTDHEFITNYRESIPKKAT